MMPWRGRFRTRKVGDSVSVVFFWMFKKGAPYFSPFFCTIKQYHLGLLTLKQSNHEMSTLHESHGRQKFLTAF